MLRINRRFLLGAFFTITLIAHVAFAQDTDRLPAGFKNYDSRYYVIKTDLTGDAVRETVLRMTKMAEEYHERTKDFSGTISQRMPFLLFSDKRDYYAAGAPPDSAGVFDGEKLMAIAGDKTSPMTWHIVQHEGFHQFAHAVIRGELPIWVNEGLAEYFGEGVFTGDGFITGVIPAGRLKRVQEEMKTFDAFRPVSEMMALSHEEWNSRLTINNYDQAWSMVHFLAHGEDGKYQKAFSGYMRDIGKGRPSRNAWQDNFGDAEGFEKRWRDYWTNLPDNPTLNLYVRAAVATTTSFVARAAAQKQGFDDFDEYTKVAKAKQLKTSDADWLPPALAEQALDLAGKVGKWSLATVAKQTVVVAEMEDGSRFVGSFQLHGNKVDHVTVDFDEMKAVLAKANDLVTAGQKDKARQLVQDAIHKNPKSAMIDDARKFLADNK